MSIYVGANSAKRNVSSLYLGKGGSVKKVTTGYHSTSKSKFYEYVAPPGQQVFTASGTFTPPSGVKSVDVFLVGGGGRGGGLWYWHHKFWGTPTENITEYKAGNGGGGGYTTTVKGVSVTPGQQYSIVVGAGSTADYSNPRNNDTQVYSGGSSSALGYSAAGGRNGCANYYWNSVNLANGGSAGGEGAWWDWRSVPNYYGTSYERYAGAGGTNGGWGYGNADSSGGNTVLTDQNGFKPQGSTTRAFGESSGTLYSGGGGGSCCYSYTGAGYCGAGGSGGGMAGTYESGISQAAANTGGGGGANYVKSGLVVYSSDESKWESDEYSYSARGHYGGSGIVIIRWGY